MIHMDSFFGSGMITSFVYHLDVLLFFIFWIPVVDIHFIPILVYLIKWFYFMISGELFHLRNFHKALPLKGFCLVLNQHKGKIDMSPILLGLIL